MTKENRITNGTVYLALNKQNNKAYIGATTDSLDSRKKDHIQKAYIGVGAAFQDAILTYGPDAFR